MAHKTLQAGAPSVPLMPGMVLKLEALSPTADSAVTGVTSSRWSIFGYDVSPEPETRAPAPILRPRSGR